MKRKISILLCSIFMASALQGCNSGSSSSAENSETASSDGIQMTPLSSEELMQFGDDAGEILGGYACTKDGQEHVILDDFTEISFDVSDISPEERIYLLGECWSDQNEPFYFIPNQADLADGKLTFETLHFSVFTFSAPKRGGPAVFTFSVPSQAAAIDLWANRAAANKHAHDAADAEVEPVLRQLCDGVSAELGLQKGEYAGELMRYVAAHDSKTELMRAFVDSDAEAVAKIAVNAVVEGFAGKYLKGKCPELMTKSWGDHTANIAKSFETGNVKDAANEITKTIAGNIVPAFGLMDNYSKLIVALADVWESDAIEEQYQKYARLAKEGAVSDGDWDRIKVALGGAARRLSTKNINIDDLRTVFEDRFRNSEAIEADAAQFRKQAIRWTQRGLLDINLWYWYKDCPGMQQRLDKIYRIREMLRDLFTENGELQKGEYGRNKSDNEFLDEMAWYWLHYGVSGRREFYQFCRENGLMPKDITAVGDGAEYVWVLIGKEIEKNDNIIEDNLKMEYSASETEHIYTYWEHNDNWTAPEQSAAFKSTCSAAPQTVKAGESVTFHLTCEITDNYVEEDENRMTDTVEMQIPANWTGNLNYCRMELFGEEGYEPERIPESDAVINFPAKAEKDEIQTISYEGSGSVTKWTYQYKALNEGKPHHWKKIAVNQKKSDDTKDELGWSKFTVSEAEHSYQVQATVDKKTQHATFTSTCTVPPDTLKAGERVVLDLTDAISDCNDEDWYWGDYVSAGVDLPFLDYGMRTGARWDLPAATEGETNVCAMDAIGDFGEPPTRIPSAQVVLEMPEGSEEYQQLSVYFSGSGSTTEWVYQWEAIE